LLLKVHDMSWFLSRWRRLKELGILGINQRNAALILDHNPRALYPIVDDKQRMRDLCRDIRVPTPQIYAALKSHSELRQLSKVLSNRNDFVIKPNRGSAGRGVLVIVGREGNRFLRHNGETLTLEHLRQHVSDVLSGMYSLGALPDYALIQQRVRLHPAFDRVAFQGIPDIRIVLYRNEPAMAMLRLPTRESNGRANLHQGGLGVGIDLQSGLTHHAVQKNRMVVGHPDTGVPVIGLRVPFWNRIVEMSQRVAEAIGLGYLGVDIVIDANDGPMLLEANARPGLAIQIANAQGLIPRLAEIDEMKTAAVFKLRRDKTIQDKDRLRKSA
jgi:alpha-L-glutamate ligase-like protein